MNAQIDFLKRCKELGVHGGKLSDWLDEIASLRAEVEALKQQVEQVEQETVEACAKVCKALADCDENTEPYRQGASWCEEAIRSGAWKEYK